jgi:hypothetical protein
VRNPKLDVYVGILSHARPGTVNKVEAMVGEATWYVGEGEGETYKSAGARNVKETGRLIPSRNAILNDAFEIGVPAVQFNDDVTSLKRVTFLEGKKRGVHISFEESVQMMLSALEQTGVKLAGIAPTANPLNWDPRKPVNTRNFIIADFTVCLPTELRYDINMAIKEDYDYTLQHIHKYGGVARCNEVLSDFKHKSAGGVTDVRTAALEQAMIRYLKNKWGSVIKDNPRRPNEILLKIPG